MAEGGIVLLHGSFRSALAYVSGGACLAVFTLTSCSTNEKRITLVPVNLENLDQPGF